MKKYKASAIVGGNTLCHQIIMAANKTEAIKKIDKADGIIANLVKDGGRINITRYNKINKWFDDNFHPAFGMVFIGVFVGSILGVVASYFN